MLVVLNFRVGWWVDLGLSSTLFIRSVGLVFSPRRPTESVVTRRNVTSRSVPKRREISGLRMIRIRARSTVGMG